MPRVVELADFRPSPRHDGQEWTSVRIEETDDPVGGEWTEVETVALDPLDEDPKKPGLRSFTTAVGEKDWYRLVFLAGDGESEPSPFAAWKAPQFRPVVDEVGAILRARTYANASEEGKGGDLAGGELVGNFSDETSPTKDQVEELIPQAAVDVTLEVGTVPGELFAEARRVAALRAATEIERSYIPEQADETKTIYQTLRLTFEEELKRLAKTLQWWVLARRLEEKSE
jgi:hypothetical protein